MKHDSYRKFSAEAYKVTGKEIERGEIIDGWEVIDEFIDSTNGFKAMTLRNENKIVIAFAGTDGLSRPDIVADYHIATANFTGQFTSVEQYIEHVAKKTSSTGTATVSEFLKANNVSFTGHSLGGGLAQYATYLASKCIYKNSA